MLLLQLVEMESDGALPDGKLRGQYHFAMSGKSLAIIMEHFPDLVPKVSNEFSFCLSDMTSRTVLPVIPLLMGKITLFCIEYFRQQIPVDRSSTLSVFLGTLYWMLHLIDVVNL